VTQKLRFGALVLFRISRVMFVYQGHRMKVKVTGTKVKYIHSWVVYWRAII